MRDTVTIRKVRPDAVRYGTDVARGRWVYAAYDQTGKLLGVYATAKEARRKHSVWRQVTKEEQHVMNKRRYQTIKQQGGRADYPSREGEGESKVKR